MKSLPGKLLSWSERGRGLFYAGKTKKSQNRSNNFLTIHVSYVLLMPIKLTGGVGTGGGKAKTLCQSLEKNSDYLCSIFIR